MVFALLLCGSLQVVVGQSSEYVVSLDRANHQEGEQMEITDPAYRQQNTSSSEIRRTTRVSLVYNRAGRTDLAGANWWYRISYRVYAQNYNLPFGTGTLTISHRNISSGEYESLRQYVNNVGQVGLDITAIEASEDGFQTIITDPAAINALVPADINLELQLQVDRFDYLDPTVSPSVQVQHDASSHQLDLTWSFIPGAEFYEIEWWYFDQESQRNVIGFVPTRWDWQEAVRVETPSQRYSIPLTYPEGRIYYRVRGVGRFTQSVSNVYDQKVKSSDWSTVGSFTISGNDEFEADRNWQFTQTFAEEGKQKKVISYFDEGLKNRQTQTNLNTEEHTLVATSHYDVEGRPVVNILPVPALGNNDLFYKPRFNRGADPGGSQLGEMGYNRLHFDRAVSACQPTLVDPLVDSYQGEWGGAGHYFSPQQLNNPASDGIHRAYVPDAQGYPLTQMRYLDDGSGRVTAQSGVGDFYQLGSGRETRYFYSSTSNYRLQRLFGSNVGDAVYYKRNVVRDANGQLSISYLDVAGRVVATALGGDKPSNTLTHHDPDGTNAAIPLQSITENLLDNNIISADGKRSTSSYPLMNEEEGQRAFFTYDLSGIDQQLLFDGVPYCESCDYRLLIEVFDPCNQAVVLLAPGVGNLASLYSLDPLNGDHGGSSDTRIVRKIEGSDACDGPYYDVFSNELKFDITMDQVGVYTIVKKLEVIDLEVNDLSFHAVTVPDLPLDVYSCIFTCPNCPPNGDTNDNNGGSTGRNCTLPQYCETSVLDSILLQTDGCESLYNQLIRQVSPGGCKFEQSPPWWTGLIDNIEFEYAQSTTMGTNSDLQARLSNPALWQDVWAESLIQAHPEYERYVLCRNTEASREFDLRLMNAQSWRDLSPTLPNTIFISDGGSHYNGDGTNEVQFQDIMALDPMFSAALMEGFYAHYTDPSQQAIPLSADMVQAVATALNNYGCDAAGGTTAIYTCLGAELEAALNNYTILNPGNILQAHVVKFLLTQFVGTSLEINLDADVEEEEDEFVFQLFKAIYLAEKERIRRDLRQDWAPVLSGSDPCRIVEETPLLDIEFPTGNGSNSQADADAEQQAFCDNLEDTRVAEWMNFITDCNDGTFDLVGIEANLRTYASAGCAGDNPLMYILREDWSAPADPALDFVYNQLDGNGCHLSFAQSYVYFFDSVYQEIQVDNTTRVIPKIDTVDVLIEAYEDWCEEQLMTENIFKEELIRQALVNELLTAFLAQRRCLTEDIETFYVNYGMREYHYTLYYYDQAGNLIQTVPPAGVRPVAEQHFTNGNWDGTEPQHEQLTQYQYNTLGQVVQQYSPDGGQSNFLYDYAQRLRVSQDAEQAPDSPTAAEDYSFTSYDAQGRIIRVGELKNVAIKFADISEDQLNTIDFPTATDGAYTDVVTTEYNNPGLEDSAFGQENLRGRVSLTKNEFVTTRYTYDEHGNVKALQHQVAQLDQRKVRVDYDYDLISGNVREVAYQAGEIDQFYHRYAYDADNRLTEVHTSDDGVLWERDARYEYYQHGPLARMELGADKVQGLDYYYTLQG